MSSTSAAHGGNAHPEVIYIRRASHDDHDDHHGGAWKIAFADFMTAMMCFFLVMWLINAANEQTKAAVASYFNPIKLTDRNASRKGLEDIGEGAVDVEDPANQLTEAKQAGPARNGEQKQSGTETGETRDYSDDHLFSNPYAVLAEIASETGTRQNISTRGEGGAQDSGPATGASGGESFRDPFAPDFWSREMTPTGEAQTEGGSAAPKEQEEPEQPASSVADAAPPAPAAAPVPAAAALQPPLETKPEPQPEPAGAASSRRESIEKEAGEIREDIRKALNAAPGNLPGLAVEPTARGVLISLTDELSFGMFQVGSAVPRRDLVLAMEKIARIVGARSGNVHVNGHTDSRPYSGQSYDNWRLSTARAHSAYYMLVRGGLDERRVTEIAGFADRNLKLPNDPYSAANRRIEILLEVDG